ncbi:JmjC domain-containing protein 7, partial [Bienertia sinuspersici]
KDETFLVSPLGSPLLCWSSLQTSLPLFFPLTGHSLNDAFSLGANVLETLWEEVRELSLGTSTHVERLHSPPSPLEFLRNYVTPNKPCIISNALEHWPALTLWSSDNYLCKTLESTKSANVVAYAQQQNDCFRTEYSVLASDCDTHIDWASEALGCLPEAVNLWIGNDLSETSFHKDHYENLYAVVSGEKHFILLPPTDDTGEFDLEVEDPVRYVPWCSVNPYPSQGKEETEHNEFPLYFNGPKPFECTAYYVVSLREAKSTHYCCQLLV